MYQEHGSQLKFLVDNNCYPNLQLVHKKQLREPRKKNINLTPLYFKHKKKKFKKQNNFFSHLCLTNLTESH